MRLKHNKNIQGYLYGLCKRGCFILHSYKLQYIGVFLQASNKGNPASENKINKVSSFT